MLGVVHCSPRFALQQAGSIDRIFATDGLDGARARDRRT